jgi:hypothetical protein
MSKIDRLKVWAEFDRLHNRYCKGCKRPKPVGETRESWCQEHCVKTFDFEDLGNRLIEISQARRAGRGKKVWETEEGPGAGTPRPTTKIAV